MLREHMKVVERSTRLKLTELHRTCPLPMAYLWNWFLQLHRRRGQADGVSNPLTNSEVMAWSALHSVPLLPRESSMIMMLDNAYLELRAEDG